MATVIDRVDRLEEALANFVTSVGLEFNKVYNSQRRTEAERRAFKEEVRAYKDENRRQTREMNRQWGGTWPTNWAPWWRTWSTPACRAEQRPRRTGNGLRAGGS